MAFLDKLFRWKKKPFGAKRGEQSAASKAQAVAAKSSPLPALSSAPQGAGRYAHVLLRPHVSEKSSLLQASGQYIFEVGISSSKGEVMKAVEELFGIKPTAVNMTRMAGKLVRFGRSGGQTKDWKKAVVALPAGKTIDVYKK
ncbi:50S ribosomal protein L23 [Candidatus Uhrbacteria bacterium]|nr:50S ribosomal protein L23 [Candidatus Uhrbacteria bacterium]